MKQLTILVPEGDNNLSSITGSYKLFTRANEYWASTGRTAPFRVQLAGCSNSIDFHGGLFSARPHILIDALAQTDAIIIPSLNHRYTESIAANPALIRWISAQYANGAEVASICTGAFLLAATGLLDGRSCSTHWAVAEDFRKRFPRINLRTDLLITDEAGIYTNGGAYSFLHLLLYLIEKWYDRPTAIYCAKVFQIEPDRHSQSPFAIFTGQKQHDDEVVLQAQAYIESNPGERISFEELSARYAVGRRNFDRRFVKATGNTPAEYAQRVRVEAAKKALETSNKTVAEVMYAVGYTDEKAFREVFRRFSGLSPLEYRGRFNKKARTVL
ncbi:MAG: helix-turn-helix domain-containing protein [Chitinophagaceae bacterium]|nr:MAG: helix-turn-helix domain-containing protein [Chitinophagaceae bacterium]